MNYKLPIAIIVFCTYTVSGSEEYTDTLAENSNDESYSRVRRGFNMLRLGRGLQMLRLGKRSLPMLRLGRSAGSSLSEDDIQYLMSLMRNDRQVPLPRYGKDLALQYLLMNAMKNAEMNNAFDEMEPGYGFGYDLETTPERQIRPAPRPGRYRRSTTDQETPFVGGSQVYEDVDGEAKDGDEKRAAPLMRYGKYIPVYGGYGKYFYEVDDNNMDNVVDNEDDNEVDKRAMRMLRLGRGMRMLRLGKRPAPVDDSEITEADKRALRLLRLGKRPSFAMLRLGRGDNIEEDKRALRLLRLGKRADNEETS